MQLLNSKSRKNYFTVITVIGLLIIFSVFFFMYVPHQERAYEKEKFRALSKTAENIEDRVSEYIKYVNDQARIAVQYSSYFRSSYKPDSVNVFHNLNTYFLNRISLESRPEIGLVYFCETEEHPGEEKLAAYLDKKTEPYFIFVQDTCSYDNKKFTYGFTLSMDCISFLLQDKTFENYILCSGNRILGGPTAGIVKSEEDTLLKSMSGFKSGIILSQKVSGSTKKIFEQPFHIGSVDSFVLCGIIDQQVYHNKTMNLSGTVVLITLLIILLIALSLPFFKFVLMSRNERINISDALLAGISVILGTSVIMIILVDLYSYFITAKESDHRQLGVLSAEISKSFDNEINSACQQLDFYDGMISAYPDFKTNIVSLRKDPSLWQFGETDEKNSAPVKMGELLRPISDTNFRQVFWADANGEQLVKWSATDFLTPLINISERNYFRNVQQQKLWPVPGNPGSRFYIEGVYSRTTGENMAVIAKKSRQVFTGLERYGASDSSTAVMIGMTTPLYSVMDPVLPTGAGFCIVDENGDVIFHSDKEKNLNENILEECDEQEAIRSAIFNRVQDNFSTTYHEKQYNMFITPLDKLPLYLVTFRDSSFSINSNTEVLSLSTMLVLFYFLFICIQVVVLRRILAKESLLKSKTFSFDWLWPVSGKQAAYQQILIFLVPAFLFLLYFLRHAGPIESLLIFFATSVLTFTFVFLKIDQFEISGRRKSYAEFMTRRNISVMCASAALLICMNILAGSFIEEKNRFFIFELLQSAMIVLLMMIRVPVLKTFTFRKSYLVFQLGVLTLVSIIPAFTFFRVSFEKEAELRIRHVQLELAKELNSKSDQLNRSYGRKGANGMGVYTESFYQTTVQFDSTGILKEKINTTSDEENLFSDLTISLTPFYHEIATRGKNQSGDGSDSWNWQQSKTHKLLFNYRDPNTGRAIDADTLTIESTIPEYKLPLPFGAGGFGVHGSLFWAGIFLCLLALYCFIRYFIRVIFTADFFRDNRFHAVESASLEEYFKTMDVFLVGAPHSGKSAWLKTKYENHASKYHINLSSLNTDEDVQAHLESCKEAETILIDHFEYGARDYNIMLKQLQFFEGLKLLDNKRVLVISNIHPAMFLSEYPGKITNEEKDSDKASKIKNELLRWSVIFGGYHKIYFSANGIENNEATAVKDIIDSECRNSYYLREKKELIRNIIKTESSVKPLNDEEIILRIESIAHIYFNSIWNSLSEEEQFILYDIAQDGLVNLKNREALIILLNKGILVYENRFRLFSESFRNFILSEVSADEALALEKKVKETGSWNYFKTPVVMVLITIALFIFITQQETFNSILAFVTTFAAGIPLIFRLLGMLTSVKAGKAGAAPKE